MTKRKLSEPAASRASEAAETDSRSAIELVQVDAAASALPVGHPLVAAYRAGRATNEFAWAALQAVLLPLGLCSSPRLVAQQALAELRAKIILAARSADRERLRDHVTDLLAQFPAFLDSECYCEDWFMRHQHLRSLADTPEFDTERKSAIEQLTWNVRDDRDQLLKLIPPALRPQEECAFWFGYILDQGLRPPSVCEHLVAPQEQETASPAPTTVDYWVPSPQKNEVPLLPLADQLVEPGMLRPLPGWNIEVVARWVAMFGSEPETNVRAAIDAMADGDVTARRLAAAVVDSAVLRALQPSAKRENSLTRPTARRIATRNDERDKFIYEHLVSGTPLKSIQTELNKHADWDELTSLEGICAAGRRYVKKHNKPKPPSRR